MDELNEITNSLRGYAGNCVSVWSGNKCNVRQSFDCAFCINGTLESNGNEFRVLVNDGTYVYFKPENVIKFHLPDGLQSDKVGIYHDGSKVVIEVNPYK